MERITASMIAPVRARILAQQGGVCVLCRRKPTVPCLDHCHRNGWVRGVLCRGCNAMLGKLENNRGRYGLANDKDFLAFLANIGVYLHKHHAGPTNLLHPSYKTEDQKRLARNAKARKTRAAKKEAQ